MCNPCMFKWSFASICPGYGLDVEHIMRLDGWESLDIVLRYTRSVKFEKSLKLYRGVGSPKVSVKSGFKIACNALYCMQLAFQVD